MLHAPWRTADDHDCLQSEIDCCQQLNPFELEGLQGLVLPVGVVAVVGPRPSSGAVDHSVAGSNVEWPPSVVVSSDCC